MAFIRMKTPFAKRDESVNSQTESHASSVRASTSRDSLSLRRQQHEIAAYLQQNPRRNRSRPPVKRTSAPVLPMETVISQEPQAVKVSHTKATALGAGLGLVGGAGWGASTGVLMGVPVAIFTFGISIPVSAAVGTGFGATVGGVGGALLGRGWSMLAK